ncbi:MAG: hypothetical protein DSY42_04790 [Aquifex sp.]|nr:MAG: hypothetical protein DSY42_04790 [Aquifex sp.]
MKKVLFLLTIPLFLYADICQENWKLCKKTKIFYLSRLIVCLAESKSKKEYEKCRIKAREEAVEYARKVFKNLKTTE